MTTRLFLAKVVTRDGWDSGVLPPPRFKQREMAAKAFVHSPLRNTLAGRRVALYRRNEQLRARVTGFDLETECLKNQVGVIWIPTQGHFGCCRRGFVLKDRNDRVIAAFGPFDTLPDGGCRDWGTVLNARGIALLRFEGTKFEHEATKNAWPAVVLDGGNRTLEHESEEGWLNPLVVEYRRGGPIPGLNKHLDAQTASDIDRAIGGAVKNCNWHLVALPGEDAMRRFVGWSAIARTRRKNAVPSRLTSLFYARSGSKDAQPESVRAANLATLDELGGRFECVWKPDGEGTRWRWRQPEGLGAGCTQLAHHLARELALEVVVKADKETPEVFRWNLRAPPARRRGTVPLVKSEGVQGIVARLGAMSEIAGVADGPALRLLARALTEEAEMLDPDVARGLFQPLDAAFTRTENGILLLDPHAMFATIETHFFAPKSPVLMPATAVKLINFDTETREDFEKECGSRWIDLFRSPGRGAAETLRAVVGTGHASANGTIWRDGWWSVLWRHCVAGDHAVPFRLGPPDRGFVLDVSRLGSALLG